MDPLDNSKVVSVAIPRPLHSLYTYLVPTHLENEIRVGNRIIIPFGRGVTHGFVVESPRLLKEYRSSMPAGLTPSMLKEITEIVDPETVLPSEILALCRWAHEYYSVPLGEVLNCAAPHALSGKASKKQSKPQKAVTQKQTPKRKQTEAPTLTLDQRSVVEELERLHCQPTSKVALLHGVTGSGKTEVYIELAKKTLSEGKSVLILVPEIALTPQLHRRIEEGVGVTVGLWHSAVSVGKRRQQVAAIYNKEIRAVVGARSAIFAPLEDLGLIVVDEEHDPTYKQEDRVRYHARDLAVVRAKMANALIVLGSATPSLETLERVREGKYSCVKLEKRIAQTGMPHIELVDLRTEFAVPKIQAPLAKRTLQAIQEVITAGDQVIIYLNRRGFAAFLLCKDCGEVSQCPNCSISLTVHKRAVELRCHVCGFKEKIPDLCHKCQSLELRAMGAGTESLESELPQLLTGARISRLDRDQVTSATRLEKIIHEFRQGDANILLGTQMLVKGHDFPGVTLVVVVLADALFRWPDFRSNERAFQILQQVSGRTGRGQKAGHVLVQAYDVKHPVLQALTGEVPLPAWIEEERELRKILGYPPFGRLARIRFESSSREDAKARSQAIADCLSPLLPADRSLELLGPSEAFLEKANGIYRWDLLLKSKTVQALQRAVIQAREYGALHKWQFLVDIDPYGI